MQSKKAPIFMGPEMFDKKNVYLMKKGKTMILFCCYLFVKIFKFK
jgi:hypothetical protein